jgi:hypothetical protein
LSAMIRIHGCDAAQTPTAFAEIVSDDLPVVLPAPRFEELENLFVLLWGEISAHSHVHHRHLPLNRT